MYSMKKISLLCAGLLCTNLINGNLGYSAKHSLLGDGIHDGYDQEYDQDVKIEYPFFKDSIYDKYDREITEMEPYENPFKLFNNLLIEGESRDISKYIDQVVKLICDSNTLLFDSEEGISSFLVGLLKLLKVNNVGNWYSRYYRKMVYAYRDGSNSSYGEKNGSRCVRDLVNVISDVNKRKNLFAEHLYDIYCCTEDNDNNVIQCCSHLANILLYNLNMNQVMELITRIDNSDITVGNLKKMYLSDMTEMLLLLGCNKISNFIRKEHYVPDCFYDLIVYYSKFNNDIKSIENDNYVLSTIMNILGDLKANTKAKVIKPCNAKQAFLNDLVSCCKIGTNNDIINLLQNYNKISNAIHLSQCNFARNNGLAKLNFYEYSGASYGFISTDEISNILLAKNEINTDYNNKRLKQRIQNVEKQASSAKVTLGDMFYFNMIFRNDNNNNSDAEKLLLEKGIIDRIPGNFINGSDVLILEDINFERVKDFTTVLSYIKKCFEDNDNDNRKSVLAIKKDTWESIFNKFSNNTQHTTGNIQFTQYFMSQLNSIISKQDASQPVFKFTADHIVDCLCAFAKLEERSYLHDVKSFMKNCFSYSELQALMGYILNLVNDPLRSRNVEITDIDVQNSVVMRISQILNSKLRGLSFVSKHISDCCDHVFNCLKRNHSLSVSENAVGKAKHQLIEQFKELVVRKMQKLCSTNSVDYDTYDSNFGYIYTIYSLTNKNVLKSYVVKYFKKILHNNPQVDIQQIVEYIDAFYSTRTKFVKTKHDLSLVYGSNMYNSTDELSTNFIYVGDDDETTAYVDYYNLKDNQTDGLLASISHLDIGQFNDHQKLFSDFVRNFSSYKQEVGLSYFYSVVKFMLKQLSECNIKEDYIRENTDNVANILYTMYRKRPNAILGSLDDLTFAFCLCSAIAECFDNNSNSSVLRNINFNNKESTSLFLHKAGLYFKIMNHILKNNSIDDISSDKSLANVLLS